MSALTWIEVAALGGLGAIARFLLDGFLGARVGRELPFGTFAVNISGSFVLGLFDGLALHGNTLLLAGTATIGAYTTFSTWMLESQRLGEDGEGAAVALNIAASIAAGIGAVALGHLVGRAL